MRKFKVFGMAMSSKHSKDFDVNVDETLTIDESEYEYSSLYDVMHEKCDNLLSSYGYADWDVEITETK